VADNSPVVRPYRDQDFPALVELIDAITAPERVWTARGLRAFLAVPGYDPRTDAFVAAFDDGTLAGARDVRPTGRGDEGVPIFESWGNVHPSARGSDVGGRLLAAALARVETAIAELGRREAIVQARCAAGDAETRATFAAHGLEYARDLLTMERRHLGGLPEPSFPAGIVVRSYRTGEDDAAWVAAFNEAFADHWGRFMGMSPAQWAHYLHDPEFKPELSLVATDGAEITGFCHCRIDGELNAQTGRRVGMIRYVGVRPRWRRRGLGEALTVAGLRALAAAGMERATLGVDAESVTGAHRLYERLGFVVTERWVMYRREVTLSERETGVTT
jgi:mycothiol synthase